MSTLKEWVNAHHVQVPEGGLVHDRAFWAVVALVVLLVAIVVLAVLVEVDPAIMRPPNPFLDTYMMY